MCIRDSPGPGTEQLPLQPCHTHIPVVSELGHADVQTEDIAPGLP